MESTKYMVYALSTIVAVVCIAGFNIYIYFTSYIFIIILLTI